MKKKLLLVILSLWIFVTGHAATITVSTSSDTGPGSLRDAISSAMDGDVINFDPSVTLISLLSGLSVTDKSLILNANGAVIQGDGTFQVLTITNSTSSQKNVVLNKLIITNGNTASFGGGLIIRGNVKADINECEIKDNNASLATSANSGAGVYIDSVYVVGLPYSDVTFTKCQIIDNTTNPPAALPGRGAGIYINVGTLNLIECNVSGNTAKSAGGGIYNKAAALKIQQSTISGNTGTSGGGIYSEPTAPSCDLRQNSIINNTSTGTAATSGGGGMMLLSPVNSLYNNTLMGNTAAIVGGGVVNTGAMMSLGGNIIVGNQATTTATGDFVSTVAVTNDGYNVLLAGTSTGLTPNPTDTIITLPQLTSLFAGSLGGDLFTPSLASFTNGLKGAVPNGSVLNIILIVPYSSGFLNGSTEDQRGQTIYPNQLGMYCAGAINILLPTQITDQNMTDLSLCEGSEVRYSVTAEGSGLSYQWYLNNTPIPGATLDSYKRTNVTANQDGVYHVVVSGMTESGPVNVSSQKVILSVLSAPSIIGELQSASICEGSDYTISPQVTGSKLTYQWYKDGAPVSGLEGTGGEYVIKNATLLDYASYKVAVSGVCGSETLTTNEARIWVATPLPQYLQFTSLIGTIEPDMSYPVKVNYLDIDVPVYKWSFSNESSHFAYLETNTNENTFLVSSLPQDGTITVEMEHICGNRTLTQDVKALLTTGIDGLGADGFRVYPNPVMETLFISAGSQTKSITAVVVTDINGRTIHQIEPNTPDYQLPTIEWSKGIYFVKVQTDEGVIVKKIIKN